MPAVPLALTSSATARGSTSNAGTPSLGCATLHAVTERSPCVCEVTPCYYAGLEARPNAARTSNAKQHDSKAHSDQRQLKDHKAPSAQQDGVESSRTAEQRGKDGNEDKKKTTTKAERRALQERQRAEKAASKTNVSLSTNLAS